MSKRHDIARKRRSLEEIRGIMNSMKTLAYMETRKLAGFLDAQQRAIDAIEMAAADFLRFNPDLLVSREDTLDAYLLIGSERGFCGDFNRRIETSLRSALHQPFDRMPKLIVVGQKLHPLIQQHDSNAQLLSGAGVLEEIPRLLDQLAEVLGQLFQEQGVSRLLGLFHDAKGNIDTRPLLPPFRDMKQIPERSQIPPLLNTSPRVFFSSLTEQYLFALLHWILYVSLMAENRQRVSHLDGAVRHLDKQSLKLSHRYNVLRQEDIIEEIEVILLSAC